MNNEFLQTEEAIVAMLKTVYDPEIPVNVYDLGLIYNIEVDDEKNVRIDMTLTAPNCPAADFILEDVRMKIESVDDVNNVEVNLVFEPEWDKDMMSEEAKLELGFYRDMDSLRKKIYFASDAHLGARFHKDPLAVEKRLVRWLDSIKDEAMAIYFLGICSTIGMNINTSYRKALSVSLVNWRNYPIMEWKSIYLSAITTSGCSTICQRR